MNIEELQSLLDQANTASNSGNYDEAELLANKVLAELDSDQTQPHLNPPPKGGLSDSASDPHSFPTGEGRDGVLTEVRDGVLLRANALLSIATTVFRRGNYTSALEYARQALALAEEHSLAEVTPKCMNLFGNVYNSLSDYPRALEYYGKALSAHEELGDKASAAQVTGNIGNVYWNLSDYPRALEYYTKALAAHEEVGNKASAAIVSGNIGNVYANLSDYPRALEYYGKALAAHEELGKKADAARVTGNIGSVYYYLSDYPRALEYYGKSLAAHEEVGNKAEAAAVIGNIGIVYNYLSDYPRALEYYGKALAAHEELGDKAVAAIVTGNIGELYGKKEFTGYDAVRAEEYLLKAIAISEELGTKQTLYHAHKTIAELYENEERLGEAFAHYKKYIEIEKEVQSEEAKKQAEKQDTDRKLAIERAQAASEKKILNNILPEEITARLIKGENPIADTFDNVSILFMDIVDFTTLSTTVTTQQLVHLLNAIFKASDGVMNEFGLEKIKTIGDAYMAVAGAPTRQEDHAHRAAQAALKLLEVMKSLVVTFPEEYGDKSWIETIPEIQVRIGVHCGPVAAGVVGENKFLYDLWGDAVNTASRMESHGEAGKIHVSEEFARHLTHVSTSLNDPLSRREGFKDSFSFPTGEGRDGVLIERGEIDIKGKGMMKTYFLEIANS